MPSIRFIKDGVFLEEDKRYDTDDVAEVSDEAAALMYKRNWAVPYMGDELTANIQEPAEEDEETGLKINPDAEDEEDVVVGTVRVPRRK